MAKLNHIQGIDAIVTNLGPTGRYRIARNGDLFVRREESGDERFVGSIESEDTREVEDGVSGYLNA